MPDAISLGEALVLLFASPHGATVGTARSFIPVPAGARLHAAVGLARLGIDVGFVGTVGDDRAYLAGARVLACGSMTLSADGRDAALQELDEAALRALVEVANAAGACAAAHWAELPVCGPNPRSPRFWAGCRTDGRRGRQAGDLSFAPACRTDRLVPGLRHFWPRFW